MKVHSTKLAQLFSDLDGRIASVDFTKKDGSNRTMVFRLHVTKYVKGSTKQAVARYDTPYVTAYDMSKRAYRNINLNTVRRVRANGLTYHVV